MATHSSVLAWRIPGTGEPGGLPSMGSHRVRHNWSDLAAAAAAVGHWQGLSPSSEVEKFTSVWGDRRATAVTVKTVWPCEGVASAAGCQHSWNPDGLKQFQAGGSFWICLLWGKLCVCVCVCVCILGVKTQNMMLTPFVLRMIPRLCCILTKRVHSGARQLGLSSQ